MPSLEPSVAFDRIRGGKPTVIAAAPDGPLDIWIRQPLDPYWTAAFRLVSSDGRLRVGEARIFPVERHGWTRDGLPVSPGDYAGSWRGIRIRNAVPISPGDWSGCWRGIQADAPRRGLTKQVLARAQPHLWLRFLEQIVPRVREILPDVLPARRTPREVPSPRGRHAHADAFLVKVAVAYVRALRAGLPPVATMAGRYGEPVAKVRGWIHQARLREFLTPSVQGRADGALTAKTTFYLAARKRRPKTKPTKSKSKTKSTKTRRSPRRAPRRK